MIYLTCSQKLMDNQIVYYTESNRKFKNKPVHDKSDKRDTDLSYIGVECFDAVPAGRGFCLIEAALLVSTQGASTCLNIIGTIISLTSTQHYSH